jgi:hypothetical protein
MEGIDVLMLSMGGLLCMMASMLGVPGAVRQLGEVLPRCLVTFG